MKKLKKHIKKKFILEAKGTTTWKEVISKISSKLTTTKKLEMLTKTER